MQKFYRGHSRIFGSWCTNDRGYPKVYSQPFRDRYLHHLVFELVAGRKIRRGFQVHHMNGNKMCWCPGNLLEIQAELHVSGERMRCPFTGRFLTKLEVERERERERRERRELEEVPF